MKRYYDVEVIVRVSCRDTGYESFGRHHTQTQQNLPPNASVDALAYTGLEAIEKTMNIWTEKESPKCPNCGRKW